MLAAGAPAGAQVSPAGSPGHVVATQDLLVLGGVGLVLLAGAVGDLGARMDALEEKERQLDRLLQELGALQTDLDRELHRGPAQESRTEAAPAD